MTDKDDTYNGWSNYETWCANLWLSNDEGLYHWARGVVRQHHNMFHAGDALVDGLREMASERLNGSACFEADLLEMAFQQIDALELAKAFADEDEDDEDDDEQEDAA